MKAKNIGTELKDLGFELEPSWSDSEDKISICRLNPNFQDDFGNQIGGEKRLLGVCVFSCHKDGDEESYIVIDYRVNQPYGKSPHFRHGVSTGVYIFDNKTDFLEHVKSDFGLHRGDSKLNRNQENK